MNKETKQVGWVISVMLGCMMVWYGCAKEGDLIVARIGNTMITLGQLKASIQKTPEYYRHDDKVRLEKQWAYLNVLIDKTLLTMEAYRQGLDRDPDIVAQITAYERNHLLEILHKKIAREKVVVTDEDIQDYFEKNKLDRQVEVRRIVVDTEEAAQTVVSELKSGKPFEEVAQAYSTVPKPEVGLLWYLDPNAPKPVLERAFSLDIDEFSEPIRTQAGYEIIQVIGEKHYELGALKGKIIRAIRRSKEGQAWNAFLGKLRTRRRVKVHEDAFELVLKKGETATRRLPAFTEEEQRMPLYTYNGGVMTVGDYRDLLARQDVKRRPMPTDGSAVQQIIERILLQSVLLPEEAQRLKMDRLDEVVSRVKRKKAEYMVMLLREREVVEKVLITQEDLQAYYDGHLDRYVNYAYVEVQELIVNTEKEAREVLSQIKRGTDIEKLGAVPHLYQEYERGRNALADTAFAAQVGDLVGPIESPKGFVIFEVQKTKERSYRPLEDVKERITSGVRKMQEALIFDRYLLQLREEYASQTVVYEGVLKLTVAEDASDTSSNTKAKETSDAPDPAQQTPDKTQTPQ